MKKETNKAEKKKKIGYWRAQANAFLTSFKNIPKKDFFKSALFDLLTIISVFIIAVVAFALINRISMTALPQLVQVYELKQAGDEQAFNAALVEFAPVINKVIWISFIIAVLAFLLMLFFISWFYGKAWLCSLKKKFSNRFLRKYFIFNLTWIVAWIIIIAISVNVFVTVAAAIVLVIEALLFFYSDPVLRAVFDEKKSWRQNWAEFFGVAKRIHWFIFFIIAALIIMLILLAISGLLASLPLLFGIVLIIFTLFLLGWMRNYIIQLVYQVYHRKN